RLRPTWWHPTPGARAAELHPDWVAPWHAGDHSQRSLPGTTGMARIPDGRAGSLSAGSNRHSSGEGILYHDASRYNLNTPHSSVAEVLVPAIDREGFASASKRTRRPRGQEKCPTGRRPAAHPGHSRVRAMGAFEPTRVARALGSDCPK